jgi:uncharacterized protein (TIGR02217 family)
MSYDANLGLLPECFSMGARIGMDFNTRVVRTPNGAEYREQLRQYELGRWNVSYDVLLETGWREVMTFFRAARGMASSFRARDPLDHVVQAHEGGFVATAVATEWQMVKNYQVTGGSTTYARKITKPVSAVTLVGGGTVDYDTGIVTNGTIPTSWAGFFHVQVRFGNDELNPVIFNRNGAQGDLMVASGEIELIEVDE